MPPSPPLPPRAALTRDLVIAGAVDLADAGGLGPLTMRRLAQTLGVEAMSLYNHVAGKTDLLAGMVDAVVGEIALPRADGDWQGAMRDRALSAHAVLMRHPWAPLLIVAEINVGPMMLRYLEASTACLCRAGFSLPLVDHALNAIDSYVYGFTLQKLHFPLQPGEYAAAAEGFLPMLPAARFPHMRALAEEVISGRHDGINDIRFGLDLILTGLDRLR